MRHKKSNGNAVTISSVVIVVIVVLGLLGFVFYQNFIAKPGSQSTQKTPVSQGDQPGKTTDKNALTNTFSISLGSRTMTMKHPESWVVATTSDNSSEQDIDHQVSKTITSPDGKYVITASLGDGGFGGGCPVGTATFTSTQLTDLPNGTGAFLLEYSSSDASTVAMQIEPKSVDKSGLAKGQDACNVSIGLFGVQGGGLPTSDSPVMATVRLSAPDKSGDYQIAKQILLSLKG